LAEVTTETIKTLRERTGAGIMDCRRALVDAGGDMDKAEKLLREWGIASAAKKATRAASQGVVESYIHAGGRIGVLVEVNCETDFVARTDLFKALARDLAMQIAAMNPPSVTEETGGNGAEGDAVPLLKQQFIKDPSRTVQDVIHDAISKLGENILVRRFARYELGGE
jgi:elongation factor Ts